MKKQAGLWIDHRKAVIVTITEKGEEIREISSNIEKRVRFASGTASQDGDTEDVRDRQYVNHLNSYYDAVIAMIRDADTLQIFGPGEAKGELLKRLKHHGVPERILAFEAMDKMTKRQIAAIVRRQIPR